MPLCAITKLVSVFIQIRIGKMSQAIFMALQPNAL